MKNKLEIFFPSNREKNQKSIIINNMKIKIGNI